MRNFWLMKPGVCARNTCKWQTITPKEELLEGFICFRHLAESFFQRGALLMKSKLAIFVMIQCKTFYRDYQCNAQNVLFYALI